MRRKIKLQRFKVEFINGRTKTVEAIDLHAAIDATDRRYKREWLSVIALQEDVR